MVFMALGLSIFQVVQQSYTIRMQQLYNMSFCIFFIAKIFDMWLKLSF